MSAVVKGDELCTGFQPQTWRKNRCRLCYKEKEEHSVDNGSSLLGSIEQTSANTSSNITTATTVLTAAPPRRVRPSTTSQNDEAQPTEYIRTRSRYSNSENHQNSSDTTSQSTNQKQDNTVMVTISKSEPSSPDKANESPSENYNTVSIRMRRNRNHVGVQPLDHQSTSAPQSPVKANAEVCISGNRPLKSSNPAETNNITALNEPFPPHASTSEINSAAMVPLTSSDSVSEISSTECVPSKNLVALSTLSSRDDISNVSSISEGLLSDKLFVNTLGDLGVNPHLSTSYESVATTIGDESMHSALSGSFESIATTTGDTLHSALSGSMESIMTTTSVATTENLQETIEDLETMVRALKVQLEATEEKCINLEAEKNRILISKLQNSDSESTLAEIVQLRAQLREMEKQCEEARDQSTVLKLEVKELREELHAKDSRSSKIKIKDLKQKLQAAESLCEELMDENENHKRTIKEIQEEMEEMQDKYRQEQAEEFRNLQGEMEQTSKNCRILQFKLRKAERRNEEVESDKQQCEQKLKELTSVLASSPDIAKVKQLEDELTLARDIAARLKCELDSMETKRAFLEKENNSLRQKMIENKKVDGEEVGVEKKLEMQAKAESISQAKKDQDSVQLMKDLYDTIERETDLKEQLKFAEEEAKVMRKKLTDIEQENESLLYQLKKISSLRGPPPRGSKRSSSPMKDLSTKDTSKDNEKEISQFENMEPSELILQIELAEQEMKVLRRKLSEFENENENLSSEIKLLRKKVQEQECKLTLVEPPDPTKPNLYYEQKVKMLENEAKELRRKLIDKEREIERLGTEVSIEKRKSKNVFTRSRSLDSDQQLDLKRHLQLVEQEAIILRQKMLKLESDNEKLLEENRRLQLRVLRRTPSTQSEDVASENADLKEKLYTAQQEQEKLKDLLQKEKDKNITLSIEVDEAKQKVEESKDSRMATKVLSDKLHRAEEELKSIHHKLASAETENSVINSQLKRILAKGAGKDLPYFNVDTAAPRQLRNKVKELEEEIKNLQVVINTREQMGEQLEDELQQHKNELKLMEEEYKDKEKQLESEIAELNKESQVLQHQLELIRQRIKEKDHYENKTRSPAMRSSFAEIPQMSERVQGLEKQLAEEKVRCLNALKKLALLDGHETKVYLDIRLHEKEKRMLKDQLTDCQKKLNDAENQLQIVLKHVKELESHQSQVTTSQNKISPPKNEQDKEELKHQLEAEISSLQEECNKYKFQYEELQIKMEEMKLDLERHKNKDSKVFQDKNKLKEEQKEFETESPTEKKTKENELKQKELRIKERDEIRALDGKIKMKKNELKVLEEKLKKQDLEYKEKLKQKDDLIKQEQLKYTELEAKSSSSHEQLIVEKARLVMEKEQIESNLSSLKREHNILNTELKTLRETYNTRNDAWIKEKLKLEEQIREMEKRESDNRTLAEKHNIKCLEKQIETINKTWQNEKEEFKKTIEEKKKIIETHESTERRTLEDLEKLKIQLNEIRKKQTEEQRTSQLVQESSGKKERAWSMEKEELLGRIRQNDKLQRAELSAVQMKFESRIKFLDDEVHCLQIQIRKLKRERDSFREMLDVAEKNISELKLTLANEQERWKKERSQLQPGSEASSERHRVQELRKKIEDLNSKIDEEQREKSELRNCSATEKNMLELKLADLQTKFNQLEEKNILASNVRTWTGGKSKMETAWEKERNEQKRLLAESHNFAKDLQEQIRNLEKTRDNERCQNRVQIEQLTHDKERDKLELQKKLKELEQNYSRLHDTHSRLRDLQEKFKREHELLRRERDELVERISESDKKQAMERAKIDQIIDEIQRIKNMAPLLDTFELKESPSIEMERRVNRMLGLPPRAKTEEREISKERPTFKRQDSSELLKKAIEKLVQDADDYAKENRPKRSHSLHKRSLSASNVVDAANISLTLSSKPSTEKSYTRTSSDGRVTLETTFGLDEKSLPPSLEASSAIPPPASKWPLPRRITNYPKPPPSLIISPSRRTSSKVTTFRKTQSLEEPPTSSMDSPPILNEKTSASRLLDVPRFHIRNDSSDNDSSVSAPSSPVPSNEYYHSLPNLKREKYRHEKLVAGRENGIEQDLSSSFDKSDEEVSQKSDDSQKSSKAKWLNWPPKKLGKDKPWKIFQKTKIETTPVGSSVAKIGVQVLPPAVTPPPSSPLKEEKDWKFKLHLPWKKSSLQRAKSMDSPDIAKTSTQETTITPISQSTITTASETALTKQSPEKRTGPDRIVFVNPQSIIRTPSNKWRSRSFDESLNTNQRSFTETPV